MIFFDSNIVLGLLDSLALSIVILPVVYFLFLKPAIKAKAVLAKNLIETEKFKLAVESASDHIIITDPSGTTIFANDAASKITGYSSVEMIGKKAGAKDLWGGQMSEDFYNKFWKTIKEEKNVFIGEVNNRRKNGEMYTALLTVSPVIGKNNEISYFVGVERDITREKQIDQAKTEFVSLASHQLKTPLSVINWYTEMLLAGDAGKLLTEQIKYLGEIYKGNQRMVDLVNALLNVSRIELGTFAIDPEEVQVIDISKDAVKELKPQIDRKHLLVTEKYDDNNLKITADPNLVRIIFQNLISNAVKYTPEKGHINISINKGETDIEIQVKDTGYGIPKEQQEHIFDKLFRADNIRKKDTEGTGLGLYIVKSILDQSGGKVWFESEENEGTTFFVTIPLTGMQKKEGTKVLENKK